ncbi:acetyl esterase [Nocardiopsis mwathae]|uniref:Acetyl esterase n=1 Tax=Nocardiopsis mwathae TaxID=1472723 RepID=A0A7W9YEM4_9ACTN|nr:NADP-dependent oxidoreductase [Nocardiopsis mwathae]MBB6170056.1 acetyl esterase [Nocardiopsis mwathae]
MTRAIRYSRYGGPEVLALEDVPTPRPRAGQVRVAVHAAGVNPVDYKIREGRFGGSVDTPRGTGIDVAGTVDAVGPGVDAWRVGQAVFGKASSGSAATHALARADMIVAKPDWLSFEQAASLPVAAHTAYRTLRELDVRADETLLIHAVAGGVGLIAAQLATAWGARVIGTASERRHAFLRKIGVEPVAYGDGLDERLREAAPGGVDAVLDCSGRGELPVSIELAGGRDRVLTIAAADAAAHGVRFSDGKDAGPLPVAIEAVLDLMSRGELELPVAEVYPLERTADAQRSSKAGHVLGKIVLRVHGD